MMVLSDYPASPQDLVIMVNFTDVKIGTIVFPSGHRLSNGFSFSKACTVFTDVKRITREQADRLVAMCSPCGFASKADVDRVQAYVLENLTMISNAEVRKLIPRLEW